MDKEQHKSEALNHLLKLNYCSQNTPSIPELIWVKDVRVIVVCGFLMKFLKKTYPENLKKIVGAVWELPAK